MTSLKRFILFRILVYRYYHQPYTKGPTLRVRLRLLLSHFLYWIVSLIAGKLVVFRTILVRFSAHIYLYIYKCRTVHKPSYFTYLSILYLVYASAFNKRIINIFICALFDKKSVILVSFMFLCHSHGAKTINNLKLKFQYSNIYSSSLT